SSGPQKKTGATPKSRPKVWGSAATSYYLILGASLLLTALGLAMVLSSSSVTSLVSLGSPYATFFNQARWALFGLPLYFTSSRLPLGTYLPFVCPFLAVVLVLPSLVFPPLG